MASFEQESEKKLKYRLVIDAGFYILYMDGPLPVMVSDDSNAVAEWMIAHA